MDVKRLSENLMQKLYLLHLVDKHKGHLLHFLPAHHFLFFQKLSPFSSPFHLSIIKYSRVGNILHGCSRFYMAYFFAVGIPILAVL